jgi:hypothetical protein
VVLGKIEQGLAIERRTRGKKKKRKKEKKTVRKTKQKNLRLLPNLFSFPSIILAEVSCD